MDGEDAQAFRDKWAETSIEKHEAWLVSRGVRDAATHVVVVRPSTACVITQANELRSGQVWSGRKAVRVFLEDYTTERQRKNAADRRATDTASSKTGGNKKGGKDGDKSGEKKKQNAWDEDDCRHDFPENVVRAPGVLTFMCGCGYILGLELMQGTEIQAQVLSLLSQSSVQLARVVYLDTSCQAQRNELRQVPWLLHQSLTAWLVHRFHRVGRNCSPALTADQYPVLSQGHDTSGAERQHPIKKKYKNALTYMKKRSFIVRYGCVSAHNNIRLSPRRQTRKRNSAGRLPGEAKTSQEIQNNSVFHWNIIQHYKREGCLCCEGDIGQGEALLFETELWQQNDFARFQACPTSDKKCFSDYRWVLVRGSCMGCRMCSKPPTPPGATSATPGGGDGSLSSRSASYPPERKCASLVSCCTVRSPTVFSASL